MSAERNRFGDNEGENPNMQKKNKVRSRYYFRHKKTKHEQTETIYTISYEKEKNAAEKKNPQPRKIRFQRVTFHSKRRKNKKIYKKKVPKKTLS